MFPSFRTARLIMTFFAAGLGQAQAGNAPAAPAKALHEIVGFRSAHFGMTPAEVRAAIARDFKDLAVLARQIDNPVEKTQVLVLPLAALEPAPGPATVSYIFGASTHKLIQVNVLWSTGDKPGEAERTGLTSAGVQLSGYFQAQSWKPNGANMGMPAGPNALILFAGIDPNNAMVEVSLSGIAIRGKNGAAPAPSGPAKLRVAYLSSIGTPDVAPKK